MDIFKRVFPDSEKFTGLMDEKTEIHQNTSLKEIFSNQFFLYNHQKDLTIQFQNKSGLENTEMNNLIKECFDTYRISFS